MTSVVSASKLVTRLTFRPAAVTIRCLRTVQMIYIMTLPSAGLSTPCLSQRYIPLTTSAPPTPPHSSYIIQHINPERLIRESKVCLNHPNHLILLTIILSNRTKSLILTVT